MSKMSVACTYLGDGSTNKAYTFAYDSDLVGPIKTGDLVVVEDVNEYSVVKVVELDVTPWGPGERSVIQVVDVTKIKEFRAKAAAKKLLLAQIKTEADKISSLAVYEAMAKTNPEMAKLLEALKGLE